MLFTIFQVTYAWTFIGVGIWGLLVNPLLLLTDLMCGIHVSSSRIADVVVFIMITLVIEVVAYFVAEAITNAKNKRDT